MKIKLQNCNTYVEDLGHKLYASLLVYYEFYLSNFYLLSFTNMISKMSMQHWEHVFGSIGRKSRD